MKRNYPRLSIEEFGRQLILTGDLDPVYIALVKSKLPIPQQCRWLIAYWCFYHCGVASYLSTFSGYKFWQKMMIAAENKTPAPLGGRWPRGSERRHFRGQAAVKAIAYLMDKYPTEPELMVFDIAKGSPSFIDIANRVKEYPLFGPWIAFKVGDMLDRVMGVKVDFNQAHIFMFKDPVKAAIMVWQKHQDLPESAKPINQNKAIEQVIIYLGRKFYDLKAPPSHDRGIWLQEIETVLCKWKSHMNGHYPLFNDTDEIRHALLGWGDTAKLFLENMPEGSSNVS